MVSLVFVEGRLLDSRRTDRRKCPGNKRATTSVGVLLFRTHGKQAHRSSCADSQCNRFIEKIAAGRPFAHDCEATLLFSCVSCTVASRLAERQEKEARISAIRLELDGPESVSALEGLGDEPFVGSAGGLALSLLGQLTLGGLRTRRSWPGGVRSRPGHAGD
jgi:hypothetical protein